MDNKCEVTSTKTGKPSLVLEGYQYRVHRKNEKCISWVCVKDKKEKCKGSLKTTIQYEVLQQMAHTCIPNVAEVEVKKAIINCKKRVRDKVSVPVNVIYQEEFTSIYSKGYDLVAEVPKYSSAKGYLCKERRKKLGTVQNPENSLEIAFPKESLCLADNRSFLRIDNIDASGKRILVFAVSDAESMLKDGQTFFFDGTFKSCPKQFAQLYTVHVDMGSTENETNVLPVLFALLPDKRESTYDTFFTLVKEMVHFWSPKTIKLDFEAAAIGAAKKAFPQAVISGCSFHFHQCLWRKIQNLGLAESYKEDEQVRLVCRMCAALTYLPLEKIEEGWIQIMEIVPQNAKLTEFLDYFVEQWLDNSSIPTELWNVYGQRHRTNNVVEGWNCKLNRSLQHVVNPNIYLMVRKLKDEAERVSFVLKAKTLGETPQKRRKLYTRQDERIKNVLAEYNKTNDIQKCLLALSYVTKME